MKKRPKSYLKEPGSPLIAWDLDETEKTSLRKFFAECSLAKISIQPLTRLLSTFYGNVQVAKGNQASMQERIFTTPIILDRRNLSILCEIGMEQIWMLDSISSEWLSYSEAKKEHS